MRVGYHIRAASTLKMILNDPNGEKDTAVTPEFGGFNQALADHAWNAITLQSFAWGDEGLEEDVAATQGFVEILRRNPDNERTPIYIYQSWHQLAGWQDWASPIKNTDKAFYLWKREYYSRLLVRLRQSIANPIYMIPTGEIMYAFAQAIEAGAVPGMASVSELYRDHQHASAWARIGLSLSVFSTVLRESPVCAPAPPTILAERPDLFTDATETQRRVDALSRIAWKEITAEPNSGLGNHLICGE